MRIGIMGGTFDPVHYGHIFTAEEVMDKANLDKVIFMPSGNPGHKKDRYVTHAKLRYEMLQVAIEGFKSFEISDMEIKRQGFTYAVDTLKELRSVLSEDTEIIYIIGADVVAELDTWKDYQTDFEMCEFAAVLRPGFSKENFQRDLERVTHLGAKITPINIQQRNISSSEIRERIRAGDYVDGMLPEKVINIIRKERIYNEDV